MNDTEKLLKKVIEILEKKDSSKQSGTLNNPNSIPVGVSNRHIHLSAADAETLFGSDYQITKMKDLKQPGQFAAKETVTIAGPKGSFTNVRVLGPVRQSSQVEISMSDSFTLGIKAPIRESGDIANSGTLTVIGPKGSVIMENKVIVAKRHIHMTPADARKHAVADKEIVWIKSNGMREAILGDVVIRVNDHFELECHLDMDEANCLSIGNNDFIEIYR